MSEQDKNGTDEAVNAADVSAEKPAKETAGKGGNSAAGNAAPAKGKSSGVGWLALLLVLLLGLALAGGAAWLWPQLQTMQATLDTRLGDLEATTGRDQSDLDGVEQRLQSQLLNGLTDLEATVGAEYSRLSHDLEAIDTGLSEQRAELARFSAADRDGWLLAEAEYLLRLANQRLIMAGDTVAAMALLSSADSVLHELDDIGLHDVRGAVAADLAAVRAVPKVDMEGTYLRLAALIEQAGQLVIFQLPEREAHSQPETAEDWQGRLRQGYEQALLKLSDYIVIRRRDVPMQALMDPQWEGLVRQNLRMLLEQAQVALLSGNGTLYGESLERAGHWVGQFLQSDEAAAKAIARELRELAAVNVAVDLPDISRSVRALDEAIEQRSQRGGDE